MSSVLVAVIAGLVSATFMVFVLQPVIRRAAARWHNRSLRDSQTDPVDRNRHRAVFVTQNSIARGVARRVFNLAKDPHTELVRLVYMNIIWDDDVLKNESIDLIYRCYALVQELFGAVAPETCFRITQVVPIGASIGQRDEVFDTLRYAVECARAAYDDPSIEICLDVFEQILNE